MGAEEAVRALLNKEGWSLRDGAIVAASQRAEGIQQLPERRCSMLTCARWGSRAYPDGRTGVLAKRARG